MAGLLTTSGAFYDPAAVAAAQAAATPQSDGRTILGDADWLKLLNSISGISKQWSPNDMFPGVDQASVAAANASQGGGAGFAGAPQAQYQDAQGRMYNMVGTDANGNPLIQYADANGGGFRNPTGSDKDHVQATYSLGKDGTATPYSASATYQPGEWVNNGRDTAKYLGTVLAAGAGGAAMAGAEGAGAGAGGAAAAGGGSGGITAAQAGYGALENAAAAGYGGVGTAGAGAASDAALGAGVIGGGGATGAVGGSAAGTGGALGGGGASAAGVAGSSLIPGISNGQLLTTGAGLLGAAAGSNSGLNSATTSSQNKIDPRIAQYLYGANGNGGLLNSVNNLTNAQLATGGLNANQSQGLQMQLNALNDPAYTAGLAQMRSAGQGLLGGSQAPNPFTSGTTGAFNPQAGQAQPAQPGWQPLQTQLNRPAGMSTGLLGNNRPYGS